MTRIVNFTFNAEKILKFMDDQSSELHMQCRENLKIYLVMKKVKVLYINEHHLHYWSHKMMYFQCSSLCS